MTDDITRYDAVEAYCSELSVVPGATIALHVSSRADRYGVEIHRWGASRELVWSAADLTGQEHPTLPTPDANGCDWPVALTVPIGEQWRSGFYLVTLTAHDSPADRSIGYTAFVVRAARPRPERCWCWQRTPTTPTTAGAARACTQADGRCRSPGRSAEDC